MLHSTDNFLLKLNNSNISFNDKLVSFDLVVFFTNIPFNKMINIIADYTSQQKIAFFLNWNKRIYFWVTVKH